MTGETIINKSIEIEIKIKGTHCSSNCIFFFQDDRDYYDGSQDPKCNLFNKEFNFNINGFPRCQECIETFGSG